MLVLIVALYLFWIFIPSVNFYIDLYGYAQGEVSEFEGIVTDVETPRGYLIVYFEFWDWTSKY